MGVVDSTMSKKLEACLEEHPRDARNIINKVILAAQARAAARKARELVQRKSVLTGGGLPGNLADCSDRDLNVANYSWLRVIHRRTVNREGTGAFRLFFPCVVRS